MFIIRTVAWLECMKWTRVFLILIAKIKIKIKFAYNFVKYTYNFASEIGKPQGIMHAYKMFSIKH